MFRGGTEFESSASIGNCSLLFLTVEIAVAVGGATAADSLAIVFVDVTAACGNSGLGNAGTVVDGGDGAPFGSVLLTIGVAMAFVGADDMSFTLVVEDFPKTREKLLEKLIGNENIETRL